MTTSAGDKLYKVLFGQDPLEPLLETESNWQYLVKFEHAAKYVGLSEAVSTYNSLASDKKTPHILRELAQYLEVMNSLDYTIAEEKINNLKSSTVYPYSSKEAIAIIKIHNNDIPAAAEILRSLLNDVQCPHSIKTNAQELLQIYDSQ
ncbi:hypothetical protein [Wolbachia pipientis]|uniref:hypothetical protein n=1 Tax=Wolbachia pipientis TaxID=955 RepID=UPI0021BEB8DB|nr:hypothetical protein [Wolbachia pipientis]